MIWPFVLSTNGATSHGIVCTMQNTRVDCLLRVLFDSGANKTMMKRSVLPLGVNPSLGRKRQVTSVTTSALLDKELLIEDIILPEFSATTHISGPIRAIIMDDIESSYDFTINMDLMQTLGIDIHNLSKMIVWGNLRVPLNHMITSQVTYFKQFCKTKWSVCSINTMLMKSYSDINPKLLKVCCTINMTHTMWPNNRHTRLPHRGRN
jgi:hypothetical protein